MLELPAPIAALTADLAEVNRRWAAVVERLIGSREHLQVTTGLSMAVWLAGVSKLPRSERSGLLVAADLLPTMPQVRQRFVDGAVAWTVVSRICTKSSRLSAADRAVVDARMGDAIDHLAGDCTADALLEVLHELLAALRASRERDRERSLEQGEFLVLQPFLDGSGGSIYGEFGALNFAAISESVCGAAPAPSTEPNPMDDPRIAADNRTSIGRTRAAGLVEVCSRNSDGTAKQPKFLLTASLETLLGLHRTSADLLTRLVGGRLRLTAFAARRLADAGGDVRLVVHDRQGQTVGVGRQGRLAPGWLRDAVLAFNASCTCPGCNLPARDCDIDHAVEWRDGGRTDAATLHPAHRGRHGQKTDGQWTVTRTRDQSTTWTDRQSGLSLTQPSLWAVKRLAEGTHPSQQRPDTSAEDRGTYMVHRRAA